MHRLGVDTGGTFTDFIYTDGTNLRVHKELSTPNAPEQAILQGIRKMKLPLEGLQIVHGSTVATNAVLEGKGVRTAYIGNRGFADVLTIGRQARQDLYQLQTLPKPPPIPASLCLETGGRLAANGQILEPLTRDDLDALLEQIQQLRPQAIAINLLFSFLDDQFEKRIADAIPDAIFVSRSSAVLDEYREYERGIATWLNAYVGPIMEGYLQRLLQAVKNTSLAVMQSHGGTIAADQAGKRAVELLLSGPAGGLVGARHQGKSSHCDHLMTFDMGGTSTDVALIDGEVGLTSEGQIAGYPVATPMVDMHTIGAGGGSIAWLDSGGLLQVGPESAGANPGPACYGLGGKLPTVTDANLLLGRLPADTPLSSSLKLDLKAAERSIGHLADLMGISSLQAAEGIIQIANEHMTQALRVISVQRGHDPADFTLMSFGGAGGLHVCELAKQLGMHRAIVPQHGGVLSALGMLIAAPSRQASHSIVQPLPELDSDALATELANLSASLKASLQKETADDIQLQYAVDLRYLGQSSVLKLAWNNNLATLAEAFHQTHEQQFGHRLNIEIELVNLRVQACAPMNALPRIQQSGATNQSIRHTKVHGIEQAVAIYERQQFSPGQIIQGPAIFTEPVATTWLAPNWRAECTKAANLLLLRNT